MRIIKHFFGNGKSPAPVMEAPATLSSAPADTLQVDRDLFIEPAPPAPMAAAPPSLVKQLANWNQFEEGRRKGYQQPDMDACRRQEEAIKAELNRALDDDLDKLTCAIGELDTEMQCLRGEDAMGSTYRRLEARKALLESDCLKLKEQQLLVAGNSGYAELPLATFKAGFIEGYKAYLNETTLINKYL